MGQKTDPYSLWLGLPPGPRPPHLYALLGLQPFTDDVEAVLDRSRQQMACIKPYEDHPEPASRRRVQEIMNQIGLARAVLRDPAKRAEYDQRLTEHLKKEGLLPPGQERTLRARSVAPATGDAASVPGKGLIRLTIIRDVAGAAETFEPDPALDTLLGRDASCTVRLDHASVKPRHGRIFCLHGRWYAARKDPGAEIVVNGQPCTQALLADGDVISIGPFEIRVAKG